MTDSLIYNRSLYLCVTICIKCKNRFPFYDKAFSQFRNVCFRNFVSTKQKKFLKHVITLTFWHNSKCYSFLSVNNKKLSQNRLVFFFFPTSKLLFEVFYPKPSHFCYFVSQQNDVTNSTQISKQMQPLVKMASFLTFHKISLQFQKSSHLQILDDIDYQGQWCQCQIN